MGLLPLLPLSLSLSLSDFFIFPTSIRDRYTERTNTLLHPEIRKQIIKNSDNPKENTTQYLNQIQTHVYGVYF